MLRGLEGTSLTRESHVQIIFCWMIKHFLNTVLWHICPGTEHHLIMSSTDYKTGKSGNISEDCPLNSAADRQDIIEVFEELSPQGWGNLLRMLCVFVCLGEWWAYPLLMIRGKFISDLLGKALENQWFHQYSCLHFFKSLGFWNIFRWRGSWGEKRGTALLSLTEITFVHLML